MISDGEFNFELEDLEIGFEDSVKELYRLWRNERGTLELQRNPEDLIKEILELIDFQSTKLTEFASSGDANFAFLDCLYQMDLERIKFILKSFLRCRLSKIERSWTEFWPTWTPATRAEYLQSKLTSFEREYLQTFSNNLISSLTESVLEKLPAKIGNLDDEELNWTGTRPICSAKADEHVICKVTKDLGEVVLDPITRATAALQANDIFVLQYSVIKNFLDSNEIELI
jgi:GINS complex subunit 4